MNLRTHNPGPLHMTTAAKEKRGPAKPEQTGQSQLADTHTTKAAPEYASTDKKQGVPPRREPFLWLPGPHKQRRYSSSSRSPLLVVHEVYVPGSGTAANITPLCVVSKNSITGAWKSTLHYYPVLPRTALKRQRKLTNVIFFAELPRNVTAATRARTWGCSP